MNMLYQLSPSTTIYSILPAQFTYLISWQSSCTTGTSLQVLFGLLLGLEPFTLYSIDFFTQSFRNTCPHHRNLFNCSTDTMSFIPSLSYPSDHSHLCLLKCHLIFFPYRRGLTSMKYTTCTSHTIAVQSPSHNHWYIPIGKEWYLNLFQSNSNPVTDNSTGNNGKWCRTTPRVDCSKHT